MSDVEESYLDNLLKNVMEPHPVQPRGREQAEELVQEEPEVKLDELLVSVEPELEAEIQPEEMLENVESVNQEVQPEESELKLEELELEPVEAVMEEPVTVEEVLEPIISEEPEVNLEELLVSVEPELEVETQPEEMLENVESVNQEIQPEESELQLEELELEPVEAEVEGSIMEELTMEEPKIDVPELENADFSLDELDIDGLMSDTPEVSKVSSADESIDLATLDEMLETESTEVTDIPLEGLKLDESDEDLLKDMQLFEEGAPKSDSLRDDDDFSDVLSLLGDDDSDLAEINDLLKKSDKKEAVQDDMMDLLSQMADDEEKQFEETRQETNKLEADIPIAEMEEPLVEGKRGKKKKATKKQKLDTEGQPIEKRPGVFAKLFNALTEEFEPEPTEEELAKEAEEKAAAKQEAKTKKEEEKKAKAEENKAKAAEKDAAKKAKAEENAQKKKEKQEAKAAKKAEKLAKEEAERPKNQKRISPKKMILVSIFAVSVLAVVLLFANFISEEGSLQRARKAYYVGNYQTVYLELYGSELEESDALVQARSKVILKMQRKYDSYVNHMKMGQDVKALNALIEGIRTYDIVNPEAEQYGVMTEVDEIKNNILKVLDATYGIDEATARELLQNEDEISYTKTLNHIITGKSSELVSGL